MATDPVGAISECGEKVSLMRELSVVTSKYGSCLQDLYSKMSTLPKEEYEHLLQQCDELRMQSESTRRDLHWHMIKHDC